MLVTIAPTRLPRIDTVAIDTRVTLFAVMLCAVITLLCGIASSLAGSAFLRSTHFARRGLARFRSRSQRLISCQVALAVVLLAGAALLGAVVRLTSQPVGFRRACLPSASPRQRALLTDMPRRTQAHNELLARIREMPGVESAATTASPPFGTSYGSNSIEVSGRPGESLSAQRHIVSEGFFSTMGMRMVRGREFSVADAARQILNPALPGQESPDSWAWPSSRRSSSDGISAATRTASGSASIGCGSM